MHEAWLHCAIRQENTQTIYCNLYTWYAWKKINSRKWIEWKKERLNNKYMKQVIQLDEFILYLFRSLCIEIEFVLIYICHRAFFFLSRFSFGLFSIQLKNRKTSLDSSWFNIYFMCAHIGTLARLTQHKNSAQTHQICIRIEWTDTLYVFVTYAA